MGTGQDRRGGDPDALAAAQARLAAMVADARAALGHQPGGHNASVVLRRLAHRLGVLRVAAAQLAVADRAGSGEDAASEVGPLQPAPRRGDALWGPATPPLPLASLDRRHRAAVVAHLHHAWQQGRGTPGFGQLLSADAILDFSPDLDRGIAVFGDLDRADHVAIVVPGIGNSLGNVADLLGDARAVHDAAGGRVASIAWLGYDAPGGVGSLELLTQAWHGSRAREAAAGLAAFAARVRATAAQEATLTVIGHSYGGRVVAESLRTEGLSADDVVLLGAPGLGPDVDHVDDLVAGLSSRPTVWAEATGDPWMHDVATRLRPVLRPMDLLLRGLGQSPPVVGVGLATLGRLVRREDPVPHLPSQHGTDPDAVALGACGFDIGDVTGHGSYFTGSSLDSIVAITTGRPPAPDRDRSRGPRCAT